MQTMSMYLWRDGLLIWFSLDPPYNVDYSGRGKNNLGKIKNDAMSGEEFDQFLSTFFLIISTA